MKAALTGATGFVGGHLLDALLARGASVACLARSPASAARLVARGCRVVRGDLDDAHALRDLVAEARVVFHVAGLVAARDEAEFLHVNRDGSARLAAACREAGTRRLVHVSSLAVTGPSVPGRPLDESAPPAPVTPYGRSKLLGEGAVLASGVACTIVRPPVVYGPRDRELLRVFRLARRGLVLLPAPAQELSLIHARDLAEALLAAATSEATAGRLYHAAHARTLTQRALAEAVARAVGRGVRVWPVPSPLLRATLHVTGAAAAWTCRRTLLSPAKLPELLAPAWTCSSAALQRDAGWTAAIAHDDGLAETAQWYRREGWL